MVAKFYYFEGMKKKEIEFGRKILFIQPQSERKKE